MEWREKHQKSSTLIIREKFCQDIAIGLAKLCHAYGKSLPTRWQSLANKVAKTCQLVGKKSKIQFNDFHSPSALHKLLALLLRKLLYGIAQHRTWHHLTMFLEKLHQQVLISLSHFTQHPTYRFPHQIVRMMLQPLRKGQNFGEITVLDKRVSRNHRNTLLP